MKSILLCEREDKFRSVYSAETLLALEAEAGLSSSRYTKKDIIEHPEKFKETRFIFSTWGMSAFTAEEIRSYFPRLEALFYAAGTVQGFARPFLECGVRIFSAWAANGVPVSEYTLSQILLANKGFFLQTRLMQQKKYAEAAKLKQAYSGNYGVKVGLIGAGMIGSMVAELLKDYHLDVYVFDPFLSPKRAAQLGVKQCSLDTLFSSCHVISNHLANNEQTQGMLNYALFSKLPKYSTFINTGRGAQVVEDDLARILQKREDITAVLDVTYPEPPVESHPFYTLQNCFLTPHIAGSIGHECRRMAKYMLEEYRLYAEGKPCRYEVTMEALRTMA